MLFFLILSSDSDRHDAGTIYRKYKRFLYARAYDILHNREDAEDAVETAILGVIRHIERFRDAEETDILCQLSIYVRNAAVGIIRKKRRQMETELPLSDENVQNTVFSMQDPDSVPENRILDREAVQRVETILAELPTYIRDTVMLVCFYRYSVTDAARLLSVTPNAVSLRLYKARKQILEKLRR